MVAVGTIDVNEGSMHVTAVIPMYNAATTITRSLDSIRAQTMPVTRIIVVDDHSTDNSRELVEAAGITNLELLSTPRNQGAGAARNLGVSNAATDWIAFLDADDVWKPAFVEQVSAAIARNGADFASCGGVRVMTYRGKTSVSNRLLPGPEDAIDLSDDFWRTAIGFWPVHSSSTMVSRAAFDRVGGFPTDVRRGEDVCLWMQLWLHGRFTFVNQPLFESVAIESGVSMGRLAYRDVRKGLMCAAATLAGSIRARRKGTAWFAYWFARRVVRRHVSWLENRSRRRS